MDAITINGIMIDPTAAPASLAGIELGKPTADSSDFVLLQPSHPLKQAERDQLLAAGAEIRYGVPGGIVSCFPGKDLAAVRALPFVEMAVEYPVQVKLSPSLRGLEPQAGGIPVALAVLSDPDPMDPTPVTVDVQLHAGVDPKAELPKVAAMAHLPEDELIVAGDKIRMTCKRRRLNDVATATWRPVRPGLTGSTTSNK